jgi:uncharacterized membrane protein YdbT with pleckstrin-like domain
MNETQLWQGSRSQITNLGTFSICLLLLIGFIVGGCFEPFVWLGTVAPILWGAWVWVSTAAENFELTTERIRLKRGVINQTFDEVELYRVKDVSLSRNAFERIMKLGTITLETSDLGQERIVIASVGKSEELRENLRTQVEIMRDRKRVREIDASEGHTPAQ